MNLMLAVSRLLLAAAALALPVTRAVTRQIGLEPVQSGQLALANREFALELYRSIASEPGNVFISPISIAGAFGPVAAGAQGETRAAIGRVLGFLTNDAALHPQLGGLFRTLENNSDGARVSIANALWVADGFPVKRSFVEVATSHYGAEVANLDFRNGAAAATRINKWVNGKTNGRIPILIKPE